MNGAAQLSGGHGFAFTTKAGCAPVSELFCEFLNQVLKLGNLTYVCFLGFSRIMHLSGKRFVVIRHIETVAFLVQCMEGNLKVPI